MSDDLQALKGARLLVDQITKMAMLVPIDMAQELVHENNYIGTVSPLDYAP